MISILCPTRGRPQNMDRMWRSAYENSKEKGELECIFYIDDDDSVSHDKAKKLRKEFGGIVRYIIGERIVLSQMTNECAKIALGSILHCSGDDVVYQTPCWDTMVNGEFDKSDDKILFVYGDDGYNGEKLGTHGFIHKNWYNVLGYCFPGTFSSDYGDTWLNEVAGMIRRKIYIPELKIEHMHYLAGKGPRDQTMEDKLSRLHRDKPDLLFLAMFKERYQDSIKLSSFIQKHK